MESKLYNKIDVEFLKDIKSKSVDLVLTDPPYIISQPSGMQTYKEKVESGGEVNEKFGKKFAIATEFGSWDKEFTLDMLEKTIGEFYRILKPGGTCIVWFDLWKIETLKNMLNKFTKIRFIEWVKTNPFPLNSKITYLSNASETAISCVKGSKAVFNSQHDKGIYNYPIYSGKDRWHPTQKNLQLFEDLILKHSNVNDVVVDPYAGSATTYIAAIKNKRICLASEPNKEYYEKSLKRIDSTPLRSRLASLLHNFNKNKDL